MGDGDGEKERATKGFIWKKCILRGSDVSIIYLVIIYSNHFHRLIIEWILKCHISNVSKWALYN
jgi:hypothetical protein